ncbi:hypothetical protein CYLTODRAFT_77632 [Cylindrobasidium torrendii FP15055 ss-10]|uniref:G-protein coupled receptors family 1 profile domain-containing protein n=1 Tax=Cylindrobasidium torrendii FP15055 ss-10 TaxID=1314674 RepID=A0A0D7B482_9AGAR|nr:hypothetical protein CYLTODRAFT_77632 [Cylindrobasidium torrendii FP15055 ss-10]
MGIQALSSGAGGPVVSTWVNLILFTIQAMLAMEYMQGEKKIALYTVCVYSALAVDLACTVVNCANTWEYVVILDPSLVFINIWELPVAVMLNTFSATSAHIFFVYRYHTISRDIYLTTLVLVLTLAHIGCAVATTATIALDLSILNSTAYTLTIVNSSALVVTDVVISTAMLWATTRVSTRFVKTRNILRRIGLYAISCGITAALATGVTAICLFISLPGWFVLFWSQGRIYSLTVLVNMLHLRSANSSDRGTITFPTIAPATSTNTVYDSERRDTLGVQGVAFTKTTEVYRDGIEDTEYSVGHMMDPNSFAMLSPFPQHCEAPIESGPLRSQVRRIDRHEPRARTPESAFVRYIKSSGMF